jgi:hypothetical protein
VGKLIDQLIVFSVISDPKPRYSFWRLHAQRAVGQPNSNGIELTGFLEMKRRMPFICLEKIDIFPG